MPIVRGERKLTFEMEGDTIRPARVSTLVDTVSMTSPSQNQPGYISLVDAQALLQHKIPLLVDLAKQSLSLFLANPVVVRQASGLGRAVFLWDNFYAFSETAFVNVPGVEYAVAEGQRHLTVDGQIILRFKKVDANYESCNYRTKRSDGWNSQLALYGTPNVNLPRLDIGYTLDATGTKYDRLCVLLRGARVKGVGRRGTTAHWLWLLGGRPETKFHLISNGGVNLFGERVYSYGNYPI